MNCSTINRRTNQPIAVSQLQELLSTPKFVDSPLKLKCVRDEDNLCAFVLRKTGTRKVSQENFDPISSNKKQSRRSNYNASLRLLLSDRISLQNNRESITSPLISRPNHTTKKSIPTENDPKDITVHFTDNIRIASPRSVMIDDMLSFETIMGDGNIENLIFGTATLPRSQRSIAPVRAAEDCCDSNLSSHITDDECETSDDDMAQFIQDTSESDGQNDSINEGEIWRRILRDLRPVRVHHKETLVTEMANGIIGGKEVPPRSSPMVSTANDLESVINVTKNQKSALGGQQKELSNRSNLSNECKTVSTYTGTSSSTEASTMESEADSDSDQVRTDITVVDTRPINTTIVHRMSIFLLHDELRWTIDTDIPSLFPKYLQRLMNENDPDLDVMSPRPEIVASQQKHLFHQYGAEVIPQSKQWRLKRWWRVWRRYQLHRIP
jgi:hypothetical protein